MESEIDVDILLLCTSPCATKSMLQDKLGLISCGAVVSDMTDIAAHPYDSATAQHWVDGKTAELSDPDTEVADYMVCCTGMATDLADRLGAAAFAGSAAYGCSAMIIKNTTRAALRAALGETDAAVYRVVTV